MILSLPSTPVVQRSRQIIHWRKSAKWVLDYLCNRTTGNSLSHHRTNAHNPTHDEITEWSHRKSWKERKKERKKLSHCILVPNRRACGQRFELRIYSSSIAACINSKEMTVITADSWVSACTKLRAFFFCMSHVTVMPVVYWLQNNWWILSNINIFLVNLSFSTFTQGENGRKCEVVTFELWLLLSLQSRIVICSCMSDRAERTERMVLSDLMDCSK